MQVVQGFYFLHSSEICLVGYKCPPHDNVKFFARVSNNVIFADKRAKYQKPDQIYQLIELMCPQSAKIELFARNHNLRPGWLSLGTQLGEQFLQENLLVSCDECSRQIESKGKRFKSRVRPNYDLCQECHDGKSDNFFEVTVNMDE